MPEDLDKVIEEGEAGLEPIADEDCIIGLKYYVGDVIDLAGYGNYQHWLMVLCGAVWMADAMEMMLMSFILEAVKKEWDLSDTMEANIMTFTFLGMLVGAYAWGYFSDRYGRRLGYLATALFTAVFGLASSACPNVYALIICRFLVGLGLGGAPVAFSLFAEFVPTNCRGQTLILLEGLFWSGGALLEAMLAWIVLGSGFGWRVLLVVSTIPLMCICLFYPQLPESPRWLSLQNRGPEAVKVLQDVIKSNKKGEPIAIPEVFEIEIPKDLQPAKIQDLFVPALRLTTILLWIIWIVCVLTYYGIVMVIPMYFKANGENEYLSAFVNTIAEFPGLFLAVFLIDRAGRKMTQVYLFTIAAVCTLGMAFLGLPNSILTVLGLGARMGYNGAFAAVYVYTPEVYPTKVRTTGLGCASALGRIAGMITEHIALLGRCPESNLRCSNLAIPVIIYGVGAFLAASASYMLPIETSGVQLLDEAVEEPNEAATEGGTTFEALKEVE